MVGLGSALTFALPHFQIGDGRATGPACFRDWGRDAGPPQRRAGTARAGVSIRATPPARRPTRRCPPPAPVRCRAQPAHAVWSRQNGGATAASLSRERRLGRGRTGSGLALRDRRGGIGDGGQRPSSTMPLFGVIEGQSARRTPQFRVIGGQALGLRTADVELRGEDIGHVTAQLPQLRHVKSRLTKGEPSCGKLISVVRTFNWRSLVRNSLNAIARLDIVGVALQHPTPARSSPRWYSRSVPGNHD
ncbi:unnamed protein product [Acanthosepion pharaonis]|uniref:Uncharacterized protein n=1 Tax=Acanthosepion pharaonis TaxID=158019 RepID=A0A812DHZ1_ACAPH|nr:unnamed protein product [Sepia pharaonis]